MMDAMAMMTSRLIAKRIDETSSTASARPRRRVCSSIPVVVVVLPVVLILHFQSPALSRRAYNKKGSPLALLPLEMPVAAAPAYLMPAM
jgi:hypothetical protein